jgi:hypothetical protein
MPFDPDTYLAKKQTVTAPGVQSTGGAAFDPDAYLAKKQQPAATPAPAPIVQQPQPPQEDANIAGLKAAGKSLVTPLLPALPTVTPADTTSNKYMNPGKLRDRVSGIEAGLDNTFSGFVNFASSPLSIATLGAGALEKTGIGLLTPVLKAVVRRVLPALFAADMTRGAVTSLVDMVKNWDGMDTATHAQRLTELGLSVATAAVLAKSAAFPEKEIVAAKQETAKQTAPAPEPAKPSGVQEPLIPPELPVVAEPPRAQEPLVPPEHVTALENGAKPEDLLPRVDQMNQPIIETVPQEDAKLAQANAQAEAEAAGAVPSDIPAQAEPAKPVAAQKWYRGERQQNSNGDTFFSADKETAANYGKVRKAKPVDIPKNPLVVQDKPTLAAEIGYTGDPLAEKLDTPQAEKFDTLAKAYAQANGHDAIHYENGTLGEPELHVFKPEPISAQPARATSPGTPPAANAQAEATTRPTLNKTVPVDGLNLEAKPHELAGFLGDLKEAQSKAASGQAGKVPLMDDEGRPPGVGPITGWANQGKVYPEGFSAVDIPAIEKAVAGKKLTPKQQARVDRALAFVRKQPSNAAEAIQSERRSVELNEADIPDGALVFKNGEWHKATTTDGGTTLKDGEATTVESFGSVKAKGMIKPGENGYDEALKQFQAQEQGRTKAPPLKLEGQTPEQVAAERAKAEQKAAMTKAQVAVEKKNAGASAGDMTMELIPGTSDIPLFTTKPKSVGPGAAAASGEERVLGFGGTEKRVAKEPPVAETPQEMASIVKTHMPGLDAGREAATGIRSLLLPSTKSPEHLHAAETLGAKLGAMNRRSESAAFLLKRAGKWFDRLGVHRENLAPDKNAGIKFMSDMSQGRPMPEHLKATSDQIQKLFDERLGKLEAAGAPLQTVRENYFPGMWTKESRLAFNAAMAKAKAEGRLPDNFDVNTASPEAKAAIKADVDAFLKSGKGSDLDMLSYLTRTPMKGKESFRKHKAFDDIMTGAEFGLKPISNNPIDLVKGKLAEMDRSIMANEFFQQLKSEGKLRIISPYEEVPVGWVKVNDKYGTIYGAPTVTLSEYVDKNVYEGLMKVAEGIGVKPQRVMSAGRGKLGYASTSGETVSQFATELSVLAHEMGHQLDFKYDLWNKIAKGEQPNAKNPTANELRALADLTWEGSTPTKYYKSKVRKKAEKMAHLLEAYIHAPERFQEVAPTVFDQFDKFLLSKPELKGLADIKQGLALKQLSNEKYVGLPIMGYRVVPQATGDIMNNYLSSSLYNNRYFGTLYKGWMSTANALNQTQLGMGSAFHAGFTTADVQISAGANLLKDVYGVVRGNRSAGDLAKTFANWTVSAARTSMTGDKVLNAWRDPNGVIDPRIAQVVKAAELAGGGFKLETGLSTDQITKLSRDWSSGHKLRAVARSPIALTELMAKPIMEFLVPRQKAGVFAELAWRLIEQHPGESLEALTPQFRQAWNRVDARLGQVRYNRMFTNNTAKNIVQGLVRAPGWTGGTIAEIGGAFPDAAKFFKEWIATGKAPENIPDRVAYTTSLLLTVGAINGALTYAFTGKTPTGMDYFAFRTGTKDKDGNDERFLIPSYMKDILAYATHPMTTLVNKSHPLISMLDDVLVKNRDYYGYEIRDPNANVAAQVGQSLKYVVKSFEPFWTRGARKEMNEGAGVGSVVAPYFGVMPAPAYINRSAIQNKISELYHKRTGDRTKPYDSRDADALKRTAHDSSTMDIYMFKRLPASDKEALMKDMTPEEQSRYQAPTGSSVGPFDSFFKKRHKK